MPGQQIPNQAPLVTTAAGPSVQQFPNTGLVQKLGSNTTTQIFVVGIDTVSVARRPPGIVYYSFPNVPKLTLQPNSTAFFYVNFVGFSITGIYTIQPFAYTEGSGVPVFGLAFSQTGATYTSWGAKVNLVNTAAIPFILYGVLLVKI